MDSQWANGMDKAKCRDSTVTPNARCFGLSFVSPILAVPSLTNLFRAAGQNLLRFAPASIDGDAFASFLVSNQESFFDLFLCRIPWKVDRFRNSIICVFLKSRLNLDVPDRRYLKGRNEKILYPFRDLGQLLKGDPF